MSHRSNLGPSHDINCRTRMRTIYHISMTVSILESAILSDVINRLMFYSMLDKVLYGTPGLMVTKFGSHTHGLDIWGHGVKMELFIYRL